MNPGAAIARLARMDGREARFRLVGAARGLADRARYHTAAPRWRREDLAKIVSGGAVGVAAKSLARGQVERAEEALQAYFTARSSIWPVSAARRADVTAVIGGHFPLAAEAAAARADAIVAGHYDLLGYPALVCGRVPEWNVDPVHGRTAPAGFWADVRYLDPSNGDHKVIWELNRHQHWVSLGRAWWLCGRPEYLRTWLDQLHAWLNANPPLHGINWASMLELAFRCISWTWALEFFAGSTIDGRPWIADLLVGIDRQLRHVERNLSRYFSPNTHLSGEALALYVVSQALPELAASPRRATLGRSILLEESTRQVRPDGGHAELSTHYHRYSTDFYLLATIVARNSGDPAAAAFERTARAHAEYLRTVADDSGGLQMIGDDDGGQLFAMCGTRPADVRTTLAVAAELLNAPSLAVSDATEEACWILGRAPQVLRPPSASGRPAPPAPWPSRLLPDSGYFVARTPGALAIFDVGCHGYLNAGHAHADALSVAVTLGNTPLLIDPGTGTYTMDPDLRDRLRSARLHNTLVLDGREHTLPRGPFHWATHTDARIVAALTSADGDVAQGAHDGYPGVRHVRTLFAFPGTGWLILDQLLGTGRHEVELFWHVHPAWAGSGAARRVLLNGPFGRRAVLATTAESLSWISDGPLAVHAPEYGRVEPAPVVRAATAGALPVALATFVGIGAAATDELSVDVETTDPGARGWFGSAVTVRGRTVDILGLVAATHGPETRWAPRPWGTPTLDTDGRLAAVWSCGAERRTVVVGGSSVRHRPELAPALHVGRA